MAKNDSISRQEITAFMPLMSLFPLSLGVCGGWEHRANVVFMDTSKNTVHGVGGQFKRLVVFVGFCILMGFISVDFSELFEFYNL